MISFDRIISYFPQIITKFPVTINIVIISFALGLLFGCLLAFIRIKKIPVFNQIAAVVISYIRCTPIITQMFVVYFGMPKVLSMMGFNSNGIDNVVYVYIAYSLNMGGFLGETIRSSILAVPFGQTEAGRSIGLSESQTLMHIVVPQATRIAMPMLGTTFIMLFKATALAYMVGVIDMIGNARSIGVRTGHTIEGYICCAIIFAIISIVLEQVFNYIDGRLDFGHSSKMIVKKVKKA